MGSKKTISKAASKGSAKAAIKGKTNKQAATKPAKKKVDKRAVRPSATLAVPAARIRKIMREADEIAGMSADAIHTVGKAVEMFVNRLARTAQAAAEADGRKIVSYKDVAAVVAQDDAMHFLQDIVPERVTAAEALRMYADSSGTFDVTFHSDTRIEAARQDHAADGKGE